MDVSHGSSTSSDGLPRMALLALSRSSVSAAGANERRGWWVVAATAAPRAASCGGAVALPQRLHMHTATTAATPPQMAINTADAVVPTETYSSPAPMLGRGDGRNRPFEVTGGPSTAGAMLEAAWRPLRVAASSDGAAGGVVIAGLVGRHVLAVLVVAGCASAMHKRPDSSSRTRERLAAGGTLYVSHRVPFT